MIRVQMDLEDTRDGETQIKRPSKFVWQTRQWLQNLPKLTKFLFVGAGFVHCPGGLCDAEVEASTFYPFVLAHLQLKLSLNFSFSYRPDQSAADVFIELTII